MYCTEKITYETRREAYEALRHFRKCKSGTVYECDVCGKWHITHMSRDRWRARKIQVDELQNGKRKKQRLATLLQELSGLRAATHGAREKRGGAIKR